MTASVALITFGCIADRCLCLIFGKKLLLFRREINTVRSREYFYFHCVYTILCFIYGSAFRLRRPGEIGLNINVIAINGPGNVLAKPNFASRAIAKNSSRQLKTEEEMQIGQRSNHHDD